jgi:hypothetical protein
VTRIRNPVMAFETLYVFNDDNWSAWGTIPSKRSQRGPGAVLVPRQRTDGVAGLVIGVTYPFLLRLSSLVYMLSNRAGGDRS